MQDLANLIRQPQLCIRPEFLLVFHLAPQYCADTETRPPIFQLQRSIPTNTEHIACDRGDIMEIFSI